MPDIQNKIPDNGNSGPQHIRLTARLTLAAYDAISEIQRRHRTQTGRVSPLWKVLDAAIAIYAQEQGIEVKK